MEIKRAVTNKRAVFLLLVTIIVFITLVGRMVYIQTAQTVNGNDLVKMGEQRWTQEQVIEGKRGTIFDREGSAIAQEVPSYTVYAVLDEGQRFYVRKPEETAVTLSPYINMSEDDLLRLLTSDRFQVELGSGARNLTYERMKEIEELELEGIYFREEPRRYYPKQTYASHVIGYTDRDMEEARMGLERNLDEYLRAEDGKIQFQTDGSWIRLPNSNERVTPPKNGQDIYTTLDSNIQTALEQVMTQVDENYEPERMIAIVANPKTGEILAMSNRPSFNPNEYENITNYLNYAVADRYEPGSTMKIFTLAAAIEEGVYNGAELYQSGQYQIGSSTIGDHNNRSGWGMISFDEGFLRSSNVAMARLTLEKLGQETIYDYLDKFGFDQLTGIDLPNEVSSAIDRNGAVEAASTSFGQGTAVTPIQQVQAATAIANEGKMMKPYIIQQIVDSQSGDVTFENKPEVVGEPVSADTAEHVKDLLEQVVNSPVGTGNPYYLEGFDVIGKTGTAQIPSPSGGYISGHGENIFSFIGMAPKDDPKVLVYVAVERPKIDLFQSGSEPTALIFNTIMKHSLQYLNITPSETELSEQINDEYMVTDYTELEGSDLEKSIDQTELKVVKLGNGSRVISQQPFAGKSALPGEKLILLTDEEKVTMPNIVGWSSRDVRKLADVLEMDLAVFGHGYVVEQSVQAGTELQRGEYMVVDLAPMSKEEFEDVDEDASTEGESQDEASVDTE
ncbi:penicillin-binding transpeptidase domain-containing protein [Alkalihalobacillus hemicellulosilyticus]|uniref:serine-type D-Ala-D-Ala carboxypeptidase n=1 Tax=Halalkalibacter hemicellulosilyticusJCM 9152 TaxID=1236971 RepID=W4QAV3_9BACI|nr:penicillin-binding transpeptidase domain-containing protein [Halalkalibacter hemicellulosilyticus]GAE29145.1 penicillin-binding protein 2B [Halalkalibacter hemicellulosilyticusJCM 9152]